MQPGTYMIVNLENKTVITRNDLGVVGWRKADSTNQRWFVQNSGDGYRFKNVASGGYLAVASTVDQNCDLYCSGYPTTWVLAPNPEHRGHGLYGIVMGDTDRILDLSDGNDGTKASIDRLYIAIQAKFRVLRFTHFPTPAIKDLPSIESGDSSTEETGEERQGFKDRLSEDGNLSRLSELSQEVTRLSSQVERLEFLLAELDGVSRTKDQQWFVQSSGEGYRFKNVAIGGYLAVVASEESSLRTPAVEFTVGVRHLRTVDLTDWGSTADGTKIYSVPRAKHIGSTEHMAWQFRYISDETGEESPSLTVVQRMANAQFTEIKLLRELLLISRQEVAKLTSQMEGSQLLPGSAS